MSFSVAVYHRSVPNAKNSEKVDVLKFFSEGATTAGDRVIDVVDKGFQRVDVAVIQGWSTDSINIKDHLDLRNRVIRTQLKHNRYVVGIDSNMFLYAVPGNPLHYLRYSFNSIFPDTGIYCDTTIDPARWRKVSRDHNIHLKDYRTNGNHILLLLQRNGGWSMGSFDVQDWCLKTIGQIRQYSDRPIVVRAHPGDKGALTYLDQKTGKCRIPWSEKLTLSSNALLTQDLQNCWAAVNHNSSPVVGAAIEGYPIFVTDPVKSQCREIANTNFSLIENPGLPNRQQWAERLSMFHWKFDELRSGEAWTHMRQFIH
jgi:hypothetical protein